jgi:NADH-quinone oxidoreductase subunit N
VFTFFSVFLLYFFDYFTVFAFVWFYTFFYNISLILIFLIIFMFNPSDFKTLLTLKNLNGNYFYLTLFSSSLFSMAGIPPFSGFFTKLFLFNFFVNSYFFLNLIFLFCIIFISLYFYIQNIRYLYNQSTSTISRPFFFNQPTWLSWLMVFLMSLLTLGFLCFNDLFLIFNFMLSV